MRTLHLRLKAWIALGAFLGSFALPVLSARHLTLDADGACEPAELVGHDRTQVEVVHPPVSDGHCAVCHLLRAVGGARVNLTVNTLAWLEPAELGQAVQIAWHSVAVVSERPARAPPIPLA